jgi:hypothetical protein
MNRTIASRLASRLKQEAGSRKQEAGSRKQEAEQGLIILNLMIKYNSLCPYV